MEETRTINKQVEKMKNETQYKTIVFALEEVLRIYRLSEGTEQEKAATRSLVLTCQELVDRSGGPGKAEPNVRNVKIFFDVYNEVQERIKKQERISYHEFKKTGKEIDADNLSTMRHLGKRLRDLTGVFKNVLNQ